MYTLGFHHLEKAGQRVAHGMEGCGKQEGLLVVNWKDTMGSKRGVRGRVKFCSRRAWLTQPYASTLWDGAPEKHPTHSLLQLHHLIALRQFLAFERRWAMLLASCRRAASSTSAASKLSRGIRQCAQSRTRLSPSRLCTNVTRQPPSFRHFSSNAVLRSDLSFLENYKQSCRSNFFSFNSSATSDISSSPLSRCYS